MSAAPSQTLHDALLPEFEDRMLELEKHTAPGPCAQCALLSPSHTGEALASEAAWLSSTRPSLSLALFPDVFPPRRELAGMLAIRPYCQMPTLTKLLIVLSFEAEL